MIDKFQPTQCPVCLSAKHDRFLYAANFTDADINRQVFAARRVPDRIHYQTVVCRSCGIVRGNPVLKAEVLSALYAESLSSDADIASAAAKTYGKYLEHYFPQISKDAQILEIGCGAGFFLQWLKNKDFTHVQGIEPSQHAINMSGDVQPLIRQGMFGRTMAKDHCIDLMCAFHVFDHLLEPSEFLENAHRQLAKDGQLMMVMHDIGSFVARILGERFLVVDIEHPFLYNKAALKKLLTQHGFKVVHQFNVVNTYPLNYWAQMAPLPRAIKPSVTKFFNANPMGRMPISMALGNQGIIAVKQ